MLGAREGYPPLILGAGVLTKALVTIAAHEPTTAHFVSERLGYGPDAGSWVFRRLEAYGLISRFRGVRDPEKTRFGGSASRLMTLNRKHPAYRAIRALLSVIGAAAGDVVPEFPAQQPRLKRLANRTEAGRKSRAGFGTDATLLGTMNRTRTLIAVTHLGFVDQSALAAFLGMPATHEIMNHVDALIHDGVLTVEHVNRYYRVFRLPDAPWAPALRDLVANILRRDPELASQIRALAALRLSGERRKGLRAYAERERLNGPGGAARADG